MLTCDDACISSKVPDSHAYQKGDDVWAAHHWPIELQRHIYVASLVAEVYMHSLQPSVPVLLHILASLLSYVSYRMSRV